jgi:hypothetical protein
MRTPVNPPNVAAQLSRSWKMLAGSEVTITATEAPILTMDEAEHYLIMLADGYSESHAVILHVARSDLVTLAATMFDMESSKICNEHTTDVGREICNVFGSYCAGLVAEDQRMEIGLPRRISKDEFDAMVANGSVLFEFAATTLSGSPAICVIRHP